ncbi:MAG: outer membrane lipoprotein chaperone LolA [Gammaproteobacteria bacterium]|nr:outer membrane lipoprotein chaperone LolA [Gammaproteobacteria bacterium]
MKPRPRPSHRHTAPALILTFWALSFAAQALAADDGIAELKTFFADLKDLGGNFVQRAEDDPRLSGGLHEGRFLLQRPGHFRWRYERPERQIIIADGDRLMIYDEDLEQLTIKALDSSARNSPAGLLVTHEAVDKLFDIKRLPTEARIDWFELIPKSGNSGFRYTRIGLSNGQLKAMIIEDEFGQRTRFSFAAVTRHPQIPADAFTVHPPPGTDVMDETQVSVP